MITTTTTTHTKISQKSTRRRSITKPNNALTQTVTLSFGCIFKLLYPEMPALKTYFVEVEALAKLFLFQVMKNYYDSQNDTSHTTYSIDSNNSTKVDSMTIFASNLTTESPSLDDMMKIIEQAFTEQEYMQLYFKLLQRINVKNHFLTATEAGIVHSIRSMTKRIVEK